jgi:hypothetical protein
MHGEFWHIAASYSIKKEFGIFLDLTAVSLLASTSYCPPLAEVSRSDGGGK